jgi:predicted amidohydrolase
VQGGSTVEVFSTDRGRVAICVCYDIEFPEVVRIAAKQGARLIFCPFNTDGRPGYLRVRNCALARCIENHVYVVLAGCTGNLPFVENAHIHYAQSGIYTPSDIEFARDGIAAECQPNVETVVIRDVDLELLRRHRYAGSTQNWKRSAARRLRAHVSRRIRADQSVSVRRKWPPNEHDSRAPRRVW